MMVRVAHISDVHMRLLKMHDEYRRVFDNLYAKLDELKPDLIIHTGDDVHSKNQLTPELIELSSNFKKELVRRGDVHQILGNHDLNLMNLCRQDAITPIVESIGDPRMHLHKRSGRVPLPKLGINLWVFSLADRENYPTPADWHEFSGDINIGLFHGSIATCVTDMNWRMTETEYDASIFEGLDYVFLGDIHKQQFFGERRIAYAGSLIQQNFGEELDKGFLVWDIESKTRHVVTPVHLTGSRKFHTVRLTDQLVVPNLSIEEGSRVRISPPRNLTLVEQKEVEREVKRLFRPHDVITLSAPKEPTARQARSSQAIADQDLRQLQAQERLILEYLRDKQLSEAVRGRILDMNRRHQMTVDQGESVARNVSWRLNRICWDNLFNYGAGNVVDFSSLRGVTGIFAPNAAGKSSMIDAILEALFDATTRGLSKNIHLINDNKERATMVADFSVGDRDYVIERTIERLKYGKRKFVEEKECGKTSCEFFSVDPLGEQLQLTGTTRPETERSIRRLIGSYEDMMLTSVTAQWNPLDIIACKETRRREILCRFLDLDIFEEKCLLAKVESREHYERLKEFDEDQLKEYLGSLEKSLGQIREQIKAHAADADRLKLLVSTVNDEMVLLSSQKLPVLSAQPVDVLEDKSRRLSREMDVLHVEREAKLAELREIDGSLKRLSSIEERFDLASHERGAARFEELDGEIGSVKRRLENSMRVASDNRKKLRLLDEVPCGDSFPQCKFLIDAFSSKSSLPTVQTACDELSQELEKLVSERAGLEKQKTKLDSFRELTTRVKSLRSSRDRVTLQAENTLLKQQSVASALGVTREELAQAAQSSEAIRTNAEVDRHILGARDKKSSFERELSDVQSKLNAESVRLGSEQGMHEKVAGRLKKFKEVKETCDAYEHYIAMMGKDGLAYRVLSQKLPLINEEINKVLSSAADFNVLIEDDPEEKSVQVYIQYGQYKPRPIELASGAEKMMASVALRVALLNVSNLPKGSMFIIDEGFGKLDPKNLENINKMFHYLRSAFDHVLVVSHLDILKDMVDNAIEITTDEEGYAHVEVST